MDSGVERYDCFRQRKPDTLPSYFAAGEPHLEKNDGGIPPRKGTNIGHPLSGHGFPFPKVGLRWLVMPNAVNLYFAAHALDT